LVRHNGIIHYFMMLSALGITQPARAAIDQAATALCQALGTISN
jgi:hypothetical protein